MDLEVIPSSSARTEGSFPLLGVIRSLLEIVTASLQPSGICNLQDFPVLLPASVLLSPGLFISVGAGAINRMIKKSHCSQSMR